MKKIILVLSLISLPTLWAEDAIPTQVPTQSLQEVKKIDGQKTKSIEELEDEILTETPKALPALKLTIKKKESGASRSPGL
jgi:hypothetical protein